MFREIHDAEKEKNTLNIEFINGAVEIDNQPLCEAENIVEASILVERNIYDLTKDLPENHPWREAKLIHRISSMVECERTIYDNFRESIPEENYGVLEFLASVHDLGRAVEAKRKLAILEDGYRPFKHHGEESVNLLRDWGVLDKYPEDVRAIIEYAVEHHADIKTPDIGEDPDSLDKLKYFFTSILRDIDKLSIFRAKTDIYLHNQEEKEKQIEVNGLEGEKGIIDPPELLESFAKGEMIDRSKCKSYESFMLQYLAWTFDFNLKVSLEQVVKVGAIENILGYFKSQLPDDQYQVIKKTIDEHLEKVNLSLDSQS
ncbi:HD domain-containing protein [Candidatus Parcubacteria bacterium]|jgi:hypothetical protein|nr:HD domain-containing protein [Candidatus Parcubacteria bacterium]MBT7228526.1 HD domain-containing protein [Candidatus Parcubacteria bacterium]